MKTGTDRSNAAWASAFGLLFAAILLAGVAGWDSSAAATVRAGAAPGLKQAARFLSRYGDFPFLLGSGVVCLALVLRRGKGEWARIVVELLTELDPLTAAVFLQ